MTHKENEHHGVKQKHVWRRNPQTAAQWGLMQIRNLVHHHVMFISASGKEMHPYCTHSHTSGPSPVGERGSDTDGTAGSTTTHWSVISRCTSWKQEPWFVRVFHSWWKRETTGGQNESNKSGYQCQQASSNISSIIKCPHCKSCRDGPLPWSNLPCRGEHSKWMSPILALTQRRTSEATVEYSYKENQSGSSGFFCVTPG